MAKPFYPIPAIDIIEGKCVRLTKGDYSRQRVYNEHPLEVAQAFEDAGVQRLHLVDLDGAKAGSVRNWKVLEQVAGRTRLQVDFGGGIKTAKDVSIVTECGARWATVGSMAVKDPDGFAALLAQFGPDRFMIGADVRDGKLAVQGWTEQTDVDAAEFLRNYLTLGVEQFFCTDIDHDGMMQGPSTDLYRRLLNKVEGLPLLASGGVRNRADLEALRDMGMRGAIVGKAIYEGMLSLADLAAMAVENAGGAAC